jgi:hypothetical protein
MELSAAQRQMIEANALQASWQQLTPWLLRHLGTAHARPAVLVDWLLQAGEQAQVSAIEMLRHMQSRHWQVLVPGTAAGASNGLLPLEVVCGGLHWTLWLQRPPLMRVMLVSR